MIYKEEGIRGLYRGFAVSCVGIFLYRGLYFGLHDTLKPIVLPQDYNFMQGFALAYGEILRQEFNISNRPSGTHFGRFLQSAF